MKVINLFGETVDYPQPRQRGYKGIKQSLGYRKSNDKIRRCKNCKHLRGFRYHDKNYYKCALIGYSHSEATDIRLNHVCNAFEKI